MTTNDSKTIIYNYFDNVTCTIMDKWANKYMEEHQCTYEQAMIHTLCEIFARGGKQ